HPVWASEGPGWCASPSPVARLEKERCAARAPSSRRTELYSGNRAAGQEGRAVPEERETGFPGREVRFVKRSSHQQIKSRKRGPWIQRTRRISAGFRSLRRETER